MFVCGDGCACEYCAHTCVYKIHWSVFDTPLNITCIAYSYGVFVLFLHISLYIILHICTIVDLAFVGLLECVHLTLVCTSVFFQWVWLLVMIQ